MKPEIDFFVQNKIKLIVNYRKFREFEEMRTLLEKFKRISSLKEELRNTCRENSINISFLLEFSALKTKRIIQKIQDKYERGVQVKKCNWFENELKLFHLTLILLSYQCNRHIRDFNDDQWEELEAYFPHKGKILLQYEALSFIGHKTFFRKNWSEKQDKFLIETMKFVQEKKGTEDIDWNNVAIDLFRISEKQFFRTAKKCKERWLNHLNQEINHGQWSEDQDKILVQAVRRHGNKWALISKILKGRRTQHMTKNRYLSLLEKIKRSNACLIDEQQVVKKLCQSLSINFQSAVKEEEEGSLQQVKIEENMVKVEEQQRGDRSFSSPSYPSLPEYSYQYFPYYYYYDYYNGFHGYFPQQ